MTMCEHGSNVILFSDRDSCPLCKAEETIQELEEEATDLQQELDNLKSKEVLTAYENPTKSKEIG